MSIKKEDRRRINTRAYIYKAFKELVMEEGFEAINVKKLTQAAQINRSTFYDHYPDLTTLYNQIVDDLMDTFTSFFVPEVFNTDGTINLKLLHKIIVDILEQVAEHREFLKHLVQTSDVRILKDRVVLAIMRTYHNNIEYLAFHSGIRYDGELLIFYLSSLLYGIFNYWINAGEPISAEEMASSVIDLVLYGFRGKKSESHY